MSVHPTTDTNDNPGVKVPPPLVYLVLAGAGWGINKLYPFSIGVPDLVRYGGVLLLIVSVGFIIYIAGIFKKARTEIEPWKTTRQIINYGPYAFSRNPIYVAACGVPCGLGFFLDSYWILFSFIPSLIIVYLIAIKKEEKYLEEKFGKEYLSYKSKVRRWI